MAFDAAVVREQGVTFAVVVVEPQAMTTDRSRKDTAAAFQPHFPGVPIVLMRQDVRGRPTYWGRHDLVRFLSRVPVGALPWRRFSN